MIRETLKRNPALLLLAVVYLWVLPRCLSYQNAWMEPEEFRMKTFLLKTGPALNSGDLKTGLDWKVFEYKPRCTRPLSSYFEIMDTKFRSWAWRFVCPHPSLSLTWIFSLVLAPLLLFRLLRNLGASPNTGLALTAYYLATPGLMPGAAEDLAVTRDAVVARLGGFDQAGQNAFRQVAALVRAAIRQREELAREIEQHDGAAVHLDQLAAAGRDLRDGGDDVLGHGVGQLFSP